jgi:LuxR family transcriptional regulator, maltose regulon positive regulatory protein
VGRSWFRYHHLFADLLQLELRRVYPALVAPLHRAAAQWFAGHGEVLEAVRQAQAARDWPLAAPLLADSHIDLTFNGRTAAVCALLAAFPDDAAARDAELAVVFATARLLDGNREKCAAYVGVAERLIDTVPQERRQRLTWCWA